MWKFSLNSPSLSLFQTTLFHKFLLHNHIQKLCMARASITLWLASHEELQEEWHEEHYNAKASRESLQKE